MKTTAILVTIFFASTFTFAQKNAIKVDTLTKNPQAVFFEILGTGGLYSVNYDTRFNRRPDGLGMKVGLSYTQVTEASLFTVPVQLNYLLGKSAKYFEIGLGATYASAEIDSFGDDEDGESGSTVFGTMTFGYRKQPLDGGFMFRGGVSPVFGKGYFIPYYPYLSFGYSF